MEWGLAIGLFAAAIAAILPGMGSAKAVGLAGETAAGVSAETPEASSKLTLLQLLPATQGIYGFVIAIVIMAKIGIMGGSGAVVPVDKALMLPRCRLRWLATSPRLRRASAPPVLC